MNYNKNSSPLLPYLIMNATSSMNESLKQWDSNSPSISHTISKAIIPLAWLGTRLFPASHAMMKELFPVVGPDGIARALFHYNILEILNAGIDDICLIVQPWSEEIITHYLSWPTPDYIKRLEKYPLLQKEAQMMQSIPARIRFVIQHTQEWYGHAVYQARDFVGENPCLLLLGDHLFRWNSGLSASLRLLYAWQKSNWLPISAVNRIWPQDLKWYGTIWGKKSLETWIIEISKIIEKPTVEVAREQLRVNGLEQDEFLGWLWMHILTPSLFEILGAMIQKDIRDNGEFQLTRAQEMHREQIGYLAVDMSEYKRFDFGTPEDYVKSVHAFAFDT